MIKLKIDQKVFNEIYLDRAFSNDHRYQIYYGGSSSGKSYAVLGQRTVLDILKGHRNYLIVRNTQNTIKKSSFNEIIKAIEFFKVTKYFSVNKTEWTITCLLNQRQIFFAGLDDPEKIKSITPKKGVITDVIIEEATEVEYKAYKQLDKRLRGQSTVPKRMTFIFNPVMQDHWLYTEFFGIWEDDKQYVESGSVSILKTTYKDNRFLTPDDIKSLEDESDLYYYNVYTLGNWGTLGALIFNNWRMEDLTDQIPQFDRIFNGNDWGYSTDPFAFVRCHYDRLRKKLYIFKAFYRFEASNEVAGNEVKSIIGREIITSDSAEPKSIGDFKRMGINAIPAKKGAGSVEHGIKALRDLEIIVHIDCQDMKMELSKYKWKEDKNGNVLSVPVDKDNHLIDALRYALESEFSQIKWGF
jgi:phage terminase large subunit